MNDSERLRRDAGMEVEGSQTPTLAPPRRGKGGAFAKEERIISEKTFSVVHKLNS